MDSTLMEKRNKGQSTEMIIGIIVVVVVVVAGAAYFLTQGPVQEQQENELKQLKIGFAFPMSGEYSWWHTVHYEGQAPAVYDVNNTDGRRIQLVRFAEDTAGKPSQALTAVKKLTEAKDCDGLVGTSSLTMMSVIQYTEGKIPIITPGAGSTRLDNIGGKKWIWRTWPSDTLGGYAVGAFADKYGWTKPAMIVEEAPGYINWAEAVEPTIEGMEGANLVYSTRVSGGKPSYLSTVSNVLSENPNSVFCLASASTATSLVKQLRSSGFNGPILLPDDVNSKKWLETLSGTSTDNLYSERSGIMEVEQSRIEKFSESLKESLGYSELKYGPAWAYKSYDSFIIYALAAEKCIEDTGEFTRDSLAETIRSVSCPPGENVHSFEEGLNAIKQGKDINYNGIGTLADFNDTGDIVVPFKLMTPEGHEKWVNFDRVSVETMDIYRELAEGVQ